MKLRGFLPLLFRIFLSTVLSQRAGGYITLSGALLGLFRPLTAAAMFPLCSYLLQVCRPVLWLEAVLSNVANNLTPAAELSQEVNLPRVFSHVLNRDEHSVRSSDEF